ncbi:predicted protein [Histoplasma mississippiense (nom. inval.)]|uniref:predicted protein n=1 Tax=Ajellomyces capsulatus (strain NAm1 / WU24) TaxID=2059318 RepID=UPI000157D466|nr:predicted protein [Histoplasma mississippiense (nom. inval.)]EDN05220.1 predicted protein [Histoplasma mississippiense (nom. inval.)]
MQHDGLIPRQLQVGLDVFRDFLGAKPHLQDGVVDVLARDLPRNHHQLLDAGFEEVTLAERLALRASDLLTPCQAAPSPDRAYHHLSLPAGTAVGEGHKGTEEVVLVPLVEGYFDFGIGGGGGVGFACGICGGICVCGCVPGCEPLGFAAVCARVRAGHYSIVFVEDGTRGKGAVGYFWGGGLGNFKIRAMILNLRNSSNGWKLELDEFQAHLHGANCWGIRETHTAAIFASCSSQ